MDRSSLHAVSTSNKFAVLADIPTERPESERTHGKIISALPNALPPPPKDSDITPDASIRENAIALIPASVKSFAQAASRAGIPESHIGGHQAWQSTSPREFMSALISARSKPPQERLAGLLVAAYRMDTGAYPSMVEGRVMLAEAIMTFDQCWDQQDASEVIDTLATRANYPMLTSHDQITQLADPEISRITVFKLLKEVENSPIRLGDSDIGVSLDGLSEPLAVSVTDSAARALLQNDFKSLTIDDVPQGHGARLIRPKLYDALSRLHQYGETEKKTSTIRFKRNNVAHFAARRQDPGARAELMALFGTEGPRSGKPASLSQLTTLVRSLPDGTRLPHPDHVFWSNLNGNLRRNLENVSSPAHVVLGWVEILKYAGREQLQEKLFDTLQYPHFAQVVYVANIMLRKTDHVSGNLLASFMSALKYLVGRPVVDDIYAECIKRLPRIGGEMMIEDEVLCDIVESFKFGRVAGIDHFDKNHPIAGNLHERKSVMAARLIPYIKEKHFNHPNDVIKILEGVCGLKYSVANEISQILLSSGVLDCSPRRIFNGRWMCNVASILPALSPDMGGKIAGRLLPHIQKRPPYSSRAVIILNNIGPGLSAQLNDAIVKALFPSLKLASHQGSVLPSNNEILTAMHMFRYVSPEVAIELCSALCALIGKNTAESSVGCKAISLALWGAAHLPESMREEVAKLIADHADKITSVRRNTFFSCLNLISIKPHVALINIAITVMKKAVLDDTSSYEKKMTLLNTLLSLGPVCDDNAEVLGLLRSIVAKITGKPSIASQLINHQSRISLAIDTLDQCHYLKLEEDPPCINMHRANEVTAPFILEKGIEKWKNLPQDTILVNCGKGKHLPANVGSMRAMVLTWLTAAGIPPAAIQDTKDLPRPSIRKDDDYFENSLLISKRAMLSLPPESSPETPVIDGGESHSANMRDTRSQVSPEVLGNDTPGMQSPADAINTLSSSKRPSLRTTVGISLAKNANFSAFGQNWSTASVLGQRTVAFAQEKKSSRAIDSATSVLGQRMVAFTQEEEPGKAIDSTTSVLGQRMVAFTQEEEPGKAIEECRNYAVKNGFVWSLMSRGITLTLPGQPPLDGTHIVKLNVATSITLGRLSKQGPANSPVEEKIRRQMPFFKMCEERTGYPVMDLATSVHDADSLADLDAALACVAPGVKERLVDYVLQFERSAKDLPVKLAVSDLVQSRIDAARKQAHLQKDEVSILRQFKTELHRVLEDYADLCFQLVLMKAEGKSAVAAAMQKGIEAFTPDVTTETAMPVAGPTQKASSFKQSFRLAGIDDAMLENLLSAAIPGDLNETLRSHDFEYMGNTYRLDNSVRLDGVKEINLLEKCGVSRDILKLSDSGEPHTRYGVKLAANLIIKARDVKSETMRKALKGALGGIKSGTRSPFEFELPANLQQEHGRQAYEVHYVATAEGTVVSLLISEREFKTLYRGHYDGVAVARAVQDISAQQRQALEDGGVDVKQVRYIWPIYGDNGNAISGHVYMTTEAFETVQKNSPQAAALLRPDVKRIQDVLRFAAGNSFGYSDLNGKETFAWMFKRRSDALYEVTPVVRG